MSEPELPSLFAITSRRWAVAGSGHAQPRRRTEEEDLCLGRERVTEGLALFEQQTGEAGYEHWKDEVTRERAVHEEAKRADELPEQCDEAGYAKWKLETENAKRAFEKRWGVPLGKRVRVQLRGESSEREGLLSLLEEAPGCGKPLRLRLGTEVFEIGRIESLARVD